MRTLYRSTDRIGRGAAILAAILGCLQGGLASALTTNPIDPALPLTIHARASCLDGTVSYPDNVGNLTLVIDDDAATGSCAGVVSQENPETLTHLTGNATASADLNTGTLKTLAIARSYSDAQNGLRTGSGAEVSLYDTLTVNGNWTGVRIIELRLTVDGSLTSNSATPNWQSSFVSTRLTTLSASGTLLGNTGVFINQGTNGIPFITSTAETGATLTTNAVNTVFDPDDVQVTMSYLFAATTSNRTFSFVGRISIGSGMGLGTGLDGVATEGVIDFGNTGRFSLVVPDDVTVSSESGQFLTAAAADADTDGVADPSDTCPFFANPDQSDADGNGRGDACECGDQDGNGELNVSDLIAINLAIFSPGLATALCDANNDDRCDVADIVAANRAIFVPKVSTCARQPVPGP